MINVTDLQLTIIIAILKKHLPEYYEVWAFGSRVKGTAKNYSDLDLVVIGNEKLPSKILMKMKEDFEDSTLPFRVDVLDWRRIPESFHNVIREKFVVLISKER